ncbi:MAG: transposase, partial [Gammaproteobacteria bacterium]
MPNCTDRVVEFPRLGRRRIEAEFTGGDISSDGGVMLLRQVDRHLGLLASVAEELDDPRSQRRCAHDQLSMLRQRVYGLCLGYEDLNDQRTLRTDP